MAKSPDLPPARRRHAFPISFGLFLALFSFPLLMGCGDGGGEPAATDGEPSGGDSPAVEQTAQATGELGSASIAGVITYEGEVPNLKAIRMDADPACAEKHEGPVESDILVLGDGNTLGNVLVAVKSGVEGTYAPPAEPVVLDQVGCTYSPHVVGVMVGQAFKIKNSDSLLHNVHSLSKINSSFNRAMPASVTEANFTFDKEEGVFRVKCDVHPWMSAFVGVYPHPFFSVSDTSGAFSIDNLPAGTYEIEAWHERLGTQTATVTIGEGESGSQNFTFRRE